MNRRRPRTLRGLAALVAVAALGLGACGQSPQPTSSQPLLQPPGATGLPTAAASAPAASAPASPAATPTQSATAAPTPIATAAATPAPTAAASAVIVPAAEGSCVAPADAWAQNVHVSLQQVADPGPVIAFGVPVPAGVLADPAQVSVSVGGLPLDAHVEVLLRRYDKGGQPNGIQSILIEVPSESLPGGTDIQIDWAGGHATVGRQTTFNDVSVESDETVAVVDRTIADVGGVATLQESNPRNAVLFTGREPRMYVTFPEGYLAATGILGCQVASPSVAETQGGLAFLALEAGNFGLSAMYLESYAVNPDSVYTLDPAFSSDPSIGYEGWLYDRCATYLALYAHVGDDRFLRTAYRQCTSYASQIGLDGDRRGIFAGKEEPDSKYSHARGLFAYYALTGDESALDAVKAIGDLWRNDQNVVQPYRSGHLRAPDKLWTERLLATSIEGLYYGHLMTGNVDDLRAVQELIATAFTHLTGDAAALAVLNPGSAAFPPQNCFIHNAEQAAEGNADEPFCSGWMPALLVAPLLAYQEQTGDGRVDELFIRLTRFLRDTGTSYFRGDLLADSFLKPSVAYEEADGENRRMLVPLYGAGVNVDGSRKSFGEFDDSQHCVDASALAAAGIRALKRTGAYDANAIGPFASEGDSFEALFEELSFCAQRNFEDQTRPRRDPGAWLPEELKAGLADPKAFVLENKIGFPLHNVSPRRKLSWWFNPGLEVFGLVRDAGVSVPLLRPGFVQP